MSNSQQHSSLSEYRDLYPPLITFGQAAEIAQVPLGTVYDWSSRGLFNTFKTRCGRPCRLIRDDFIQWLVTQSDP